MRFGVAAVVIGLGGCALPDDLSSTEQDVHRCPDGVCGANSPRLNFVRFHELHKLGEANDVGVAITGFFKNGDRYDLDVSGNALRGRGPGGRIEHDGLIGSEIHLAINRVDEWQIRVAGVGSLPMFVTAPGLPDSVETYVLEYRRVSAYDPPTPYKNVCGGLWVPPEETIQLVDRRVNAETLGQALGDSILFDSDRVDASTMTLNDRPDPQWFNIGCAGHTLSKLFLTRNMIASQGPDAPFKHDERQATLKMLVADYFGDGTSFSVPGQRLAWQGGGMSYFPGAYALEARWGANGATCLTTPRMTAPSTPEGATAFPDIEVALYQHEQWTGHRRPRPCRSSSLAAVAGELRTSALR